MITLHGFPFSNYYNVVKHVLMFKGLPFEEQMEWGGNEAYLAISPVGKIPALTTADGGHLSESVVCCDYLEEAYPEHPLYPVDPYQRARVRQVMKVSELYIELACRRLLKYVFSNTEAPAVVQEEVNEVLQRGIDAMNRICSFSPYVLGSEQTMADIFLRYVMVVAGMASSSILKRDIAAEMPGMADWLAMMAETDIARKIDADQEANGPAFFQMLAERFNN